MESSDEHIERALDSALNLTFPASDPVAVFLTAAPAARSIVNHPSAVRVDRQRA